VAQEPEAMLPEPLTARVIDPDTVTDTVVDTVTDTVAQLEQVLGQLAEVLEEVFERRLLEQILGDPDEVSLAQLRTLRFLNSLPSGQHGFALGKIAEGLRISQT
jgi:hypothetical protein